MSAPHGDLAGRYLGVVIRLLPAGHRQWGEAMRAELAAIESAAERRRFALSCTRAALSARANARVRTQQEVALAAALLLLAAALALTGAIGPTIPALATLTALAWLARRRGALGPVRPGRVAGTVRAAGFALPCSFLLVEAVQGGASGLLQPDHHGRLVTLVLTFLAAAFLAITADRSRLGDAVLSAGATAGLVAGAAAFVLLPFAQHADPLATGLPGNSSWLALAALGAPVAAALHVARRTRCAYQAIEAALCSAAFAALVVALLGKGAIAFFPGEIPHFAGQMMLPGTSAAARQAEDAIAASDRYEGFFSFGVLLTAGLWVAARPSIRVRMTRTSPSS